MGSGGLFGGLEDLIELAKILEEKAQNGEIKTDFRVNTRPLSSIPKRGNIPDNFGNVNINNKPSETKVNTPDNQENKENLSCQEIGGLTDIIKELKELIAIPLKRPDLLDKIGLEAPTGVLLVGPPGTGKTLTAKALAQELQVNYIAIVGSEIMGKYYGESEGKLRDLFEKAKKSAPCLIFIDEIDSIAPDRSKVEGEVEKRVVAQLLSLMDGFQKTQGVMVLGATNRPNHLDPALRRPGRFDREVQFKVPDRQGRLEILQILTRKMPLDDTINLGAIADVAVGFVGADLKAVAQKAAYNALRRNIALDTADFDNLPDPDNLTLSQSDFNAALNDVKPSVLRSVEVESPQVKWEDIGGLDAVKQTLQEAVEGALLYPELYQQTLAKPPKGVLLWGPPGTGKTLLAKAIASQGQANFICVNGPELLTKWVGSSELAVRELFAKARQASPCVVFIDEIDSLAPVRGKYNGDSGVGDRVVGQLLTELDGLASSGQLLLVGATNRPESLDPALLRSGRLDLQIKIDLPDEQSRLAILQVHNQERPLDNVDLVYWAGQTEGWNGADLALLTNQAALQAIRNYRAQGLNDPSLITIKNSDFESAFLIIKEQKS